MSSFCFSCIKEIIKRFARKLIKLALLQVFRWLLVSVRTDEEEMWMGGLPETFPLCAKYFFCGLFLDAQKPWFWASEYINKQWMDGWRAITAWKVCQNILTSHPLLLPLSLVWSCFSGDCGTNCPFTFHGWGGPRWTQLECADDRVWPERCSQREV